MSYKLLDVSIDVLLALSSVGRLVMGHVVDVMLPQEVKRDHPRARADHLVDPLTVTQDLSALELVLNQLALLLNRLLISTHSHYQVSVGEEFLGLLENFGMAHVEHVEHSICIHSDWVVRVSAIRHPRSWVWVGRSSGYLLINCESPLVELDFLLCVPEQVLVNIGAVVVEAIHV